MTGYLAPYMTRLMIAVHDHRDVEIGVQWGRALATTLHLPITFVTVIEEAREDATVEQLELVAQDMLEIVITDTRLRGLEVDYLVERGGADERLSALAASRPGALLILALDRRKENERSLTGDSRLGKILRKMKTSYMLLPVEARIPSQVHCVVVGYDQSDLSAEVVRMGRVIAGSLDVDVIAVEAIEPGSVSDADFAGSGIVLENRRVQARGFASRTLLAVARARDAAVVVVGSHGIGTSPDALMGRTAEWLSHHSDRPVIIVPRERIEGRRT